MRRPGGEAVLHNEDVNREGISCVSAIRKKKIATNFFFQKKPDFLMSKWDEKKSPT